jgi:hypothetical protein
MSWALADRLTAINPGRDPARVRDGSLPRVSLTPSPAGADLLPAGTTAYIYHDERVTPGMDAFKFSTLTTRIGRKGVYVLNGNIISQAGSDYTLVQYRRVMDVACRTTRNTLLDELSNDILLNKTTGYILEKDAVGIEQRVLDDLNTALINTGDASSATCAVSRTDNISSTKTMHVTTRILPKGYIKDIEETLGFTNPALTAVAV